MSQNIPSSELLHKQLSSVQNHIIKLERKISKTISHLELALRVAVAEEDRLHELIRESGDQSHDNSGSRSGKALQLKLF